MPPAWLEPLILFALTLVTILMVRTVHHLSQRIHHMSTALVAALAALTAAVGRIATEVSETAQAIRDHIEGDAGISASTLGDLTDRLTAAADALNSVQAEAAGAIPASDEQPPAAPASDDGTHTPQALPGDDGAGEPVDLSEPAAPPVNQNGVGSDFAEGSPGGQTSAPAAESPGDLPGAPASDEPPSDM